MEFECRVRALILQNLKLHLQRQVGHTELREAYHYAVLPAGKLFRPLLTAAAFEDTQGDAIQELARPFSDLALLCSSVEIHHAYTLAHDDLPCMDDDDVRRGRASLHKAFGEWQAVLTGDGLLNASYALTAQLKTPHADLIRKIGAWALGPKGLIEGQARDLSSKPSPGPSLAELLETYRPKTARLIQVSLISGHLCASSTQGQTCYRKALWWWRAGLKLGLAFQLLDDLVECTRPFSAHEKKVNPWPHYFDECLQHLNAALAFLNYTSELAPAFHSIFQGFLQKSIATLKWEQTRFDKNQISAAANVLKHSLKTKLE